MNTSVFLVDAEDLGGVWISDEARGAGAGGWWKATVVFGLWTSELSVLLECAVMFFPLSSIFWGIVLRWGPLS